MAAAKEAENEPHAASTEVTRKRKVKNHSARLNQFCHVFRLKKRKETWKLKLIKNWNPGNRKKIQASQ
jgi:hypothetical protein